MGLEGSGLAELFEYSVPASEAGNVLQSCTLLGVTGSTLFPGYEGIARTVRDWAHMESKEYDQLAIAVRDLTQMCQIRRDLTGGCGGETKK